MIQFNSISIYTVIGIVSISASILLFILFHLIWITLKTHPSNNPKTNDQKCLIITTIIGLLCFEICLILILVIIFKDIKINGHKLLYHNLTNILEISLQIFDSAGHIIILIILLGRFQLAFTNTVFSDFKCLIRCMYTFIVLLAFILLGIFTVTILSQQFMIVIVAKIIYEFSQQILILLILYLFISKLYTVLKWSLKAVDPLKTDLSLYRNFKLSLGPHLSQRRMHESDPSNTSTNSIRLSITVDTVSNTNTKQPVHRRAHKTDVNLINLMTKMTLLIVLCVIISILSFIGILFIEMTPHLIKNEIYYLLISIDILMTALMIYLQFNFAQNVYIRLCGKIDHVFLRSGLKVVKRILKNNHIKHNQELSVAHIKNMSSALTIPSMQQLEKDQFDIVETTTKSNHLTVPGATVPTKDLKNNTNKGKDSGKNVEMAKKSADMKSMSISLIIND